MEKFYLEEPTLKRKEEAIEYISEFYKYNSKINGVGELNKYLDDYEGWISYIENMKNKEYTYSKGLVPARTYFLIRENDDKIIGMINIRLELNDYLKNYGGHIGYSIRPTERRCGYNKINLYLGLKVCQEYGIKEVLMDCVKDNLGSAKTMQALGAKLIEERYDDKKYNAYLQKYAIDVDKSLDNYRDLYYPFISKK